MVDLELLRNKYRNNPSVPKVTVIMSTEEKKCPITEEPVCIVVTEQSLKRRVASAIARPKSVWGEVRTKGNIVCSQFPGCEHRLGNYHCKAIDVFFPIDRRDGVSFTAVFPDGAGMLGGNSEWSYKDFERLFEMS